MTDGPNPFIMAKAAEAMAKAPIFQNLDPKKLKLLAFTSDFLTFRAGEALFRQGEPGDDAHVILDGEVEIIVAGPTGETTLVSVLGRNELIGEISILCDRPRTASVIARRDTQVLRIEKATLFRLVREFPDIGLEIMRVLAMRLEKITRALAGAS